MVVRKASCPECGAKFNFGKPIPEGSQLRCTDCGKRFRVGDDDDERPSRSSRRASRDDDRDDRRERSSRRRDDDDDDDDDDRPARRKKKKRASSGGGGTILWLSILLGVVVLGGGVLLVGWLGLGWFDETKSASNTPSETKPETRPGKPGKPTRPNPKPNPTKPPIGRPRLADSVFDKFTRDHTPGDIETFIGAAGRSYSWPEVQKLHEKVKFVGWEHYEQHGPNSQMVYWSDGPGHLVVSFQSGKYFGYMFIRR
jgi:DNA-directed RNA polymerase subunit RPC12/RpoP